MTIGIPTEIKPSESRVGMTPAGVFELTRRQHAVIVQSGAGLGSGFSDEDYLGVGAQIRPTIDAVYAEAEMIVKVKEPIAAEYPLIRKDQVVFTYFHFASSEPLTHAMVESGAVCIAYETVEAEDGSLPLLTPMSEVAGRMAIQQGAKYLEKPRKGRGVLLGGVPGVPPGRVLVLGGGVSGTQAAKMAAGLGAHVTIMDINMDRLRRVNDIMPHHVVTEYSNAYNIRQAIATHDLIVGAVGQLQFDVVAYRLADEYKVEAIYEPVNIYTARWIEAEDERQLEEFRKKAQEHLSEDGGGYLTYLAPTRVNLSLMEERWPDIRFRETREH